MLEELLVGRVELMGVRYVAHPILSLKLNSLLCRELHKSIRGGLQIFKQRGAIAKIQAHVSVKSLLHEVNLICTTRRKFSA